MLQGHHYCYYSFHNQQKVKMSIKFYQQRKLISPNNNPYLLVY